MARSLAVVIAHCSTELSLVLLIRAAQFVSRELCQFITIEDLAPFVSPPVTASPLLTLLDIQVLWCLLQEKHSPFSWQFLGEQWGKKISIDKADILLKLSSLSLSDQQADWFTVSFLVPQHAHEITRFVDFFFLFSL